MLKDQNKPYKFFGTDGVRGRANAFPMVPEVALALGASGWKNISKAI